MPGGFSLLCTGDLHLGRHPSRIPSDLDGVEFSPRTIWQSTVQAAIEHNVDAVIITGDVVDRENRYFEAYGAFEEGATELDAAGIPVVVVSGNHDSDDLPSLVESVNLDNLHLLGADGEWERWTLEDDNGPSVHLDGWSFPSEHVLESPISTYEPEGEVSAPIIGVLHADLDDAESRYAPVDASELRSAPVDAWLLGHIHKPSVRREADPLIMYPGSPQPLDPGEPGRHGPWLITGGGEGNFDSEQLALASLRYDAFDVEVAGVDDARAVAPAVEETISDHVQSEVEPDALELLLARVRLEGRTEVHADLVADRSDVEEQLAFRKGRLPVRIESLRVDTRPAVDIETLADGESPVAHLAGLLIDLHGGDLDEHEKLVEEAMAALRETHQSNAYTSLRREGWVDQPNRELAESVLQEQGRLLLDALLEQKEGETP